MVSTLDHAGRVSSEGWCQVFNGHFRGSRPGSECSRLTALVGPARGVERPPTRRTPLLQSFMLTTVIGRWRSSSSRKSILTRCGRTTVSTSSLCGWRDGLRMAATLLGLCSALLLTACSKPETTYSRETPEDVLASARQMFADGNANRLPELLTPPTEQNKIVYQEFGKLLGSLQELAKTMEEVYPEELAKLRADTEAAAMRGDAVANLQRAVTGRGSRRGNDGQSDERMNALIRSLLADPYGWLRESENRLTTQYIYDGAVAVLWDNKPILPPVGVVMHEDARDGTWHLVLPTNLPVISQYLPKNQDEYTIWAMLLRVLSNAMTDLTNEIGAGTYASLDGVSRAAGEKAFAPLAMVFFAYQRTVSQRLEASRSGG